MLYNNGIFCYNEPLCGDRIETVVRRKKAVRFGLQDVKKSIQRRGGANGTLTVSLHFLRRDELHDEITRLIAYHEALLGQARKHFSLDDARACVADYRLAHCLLATLSRWYSWQQRSWSEVLEHISHAFPPDISSAVQLRLALYSYVNEHHHGFLEAQQRTAALHAFADCYQVQVSDLEYVLALDNEDEAVLTRTEPQPPTPQEVTTLYNQWAFEAALFQSSQVRMVIDCQAFGRTNGEQITTVGTGVGAVIKRLCFLARKLGVYYDLAYDTPLTGTPQFLTLTLYGPQEVTGTAQQYGMRLERLCKLLLGYATPTTNSRGKKGQRATLSGGIVEASATVHFLQRAYHFPIDAHVLQFLHQGDTSSASADAQNTPSPRAVYDAHSIPTTQVDIYDSSIEQAFAEAFMALGRSQGVDGWRLEREPEPLLLENSIFIPDFALTRAQYRIYVEILGFWTPAYRERKVQKLLQLRTRNDLLLAIPLEAKSAFSEIAGSFPIVYYEGQLSATELLQVLRRHYDDFATRLAAIDTATLHLQVQHERVISEHRCYELLHCYRRSELLLATERVVDERCAFLSGLGLYDKIWMKHVEAAFSTWMNTAQQVALSVALAELRTRWPIFSDCEDTGLEALIATWPTVHIQHSSIFDATVELVQSMSDVSGASDASGSTAVPPLPTTLEAAPPVKRQLRERRPATKKRAEEQTTQGDLWS